MVINVIKVVAQVRIIEQQLFMFMYPTNFNFVIESIMIVKLKN